MGNKMHLNSPELTLTLISVYYQASLDKFSPSQTTPPEPLPQS